MPEHLDFKKADKHLYQPPRAPGLVDVPRMLFLAVDGEGNPNQPEGAYQSALKALYAIAYTIRMSKMGDWVPEGYFEYGVPPLEGLWWLEDDGDTGFFSRKEDYRWTSLIRQPEFVTQEVLAWAQREVLRKKPEMDASRVRLLSFAEGLCVQAMHIGPFDTEPETLAKMEAFIRGSHLESDVGAVMENGLRRRHHEIYLGDPCRTAPEKMKTVLRHPVKRRGEGG